MARHTRRGIVLVATIGLVTALSACTSGNSGSGGGNNAAAAVPGITATTVTVGSHQPLTGPAAPGYSKISPATNAYFQYVNAHGGVNGRKIIYKVMDDTYNPATTVTVVHQLVQQDKVFAILNGLGTPTHTNVIQFLNDNKVPDLFVASGSTTWNQPQKYPWTFGYQTDYTVEGKVLGSYIKQNYAGQKVCFFGQGDDFGADELAGVKLELGDSGVTSAQTYVVTNQNVGPQIGALKAAGCQVTVAATIPGFTALALGTAAQLKFQTQWMVSSVGADYNTVNGLLKVPPLLEGVITCGYLPSTSSDTDPWITLFKQINQQYNNNAPWDGNVEYGMSVGYLFVQALQAAGKNPTRESIVQAIEKGGFTGPGIVPLAFSSTNHSGYTGVQLAKITNGQTVAFGSAYTTDDGSGPVVAYNGTEGAVPPNGIPASG
ncbi:MAG TPA: ABC transporter substrate-binding protein [Micromonosporaceae bacterium]|jgi:ABC-type branched-subunit amino acid transport system substrate-binding protein|nr:ABC transporter substrate-binding protein [Micromonosporaceae bacterium]